MRPWVKWMCRNKLAWAVKALVVLCYPLILVTGYGAEAWGDVLYTLKAINRETEAAS